MKTIDFFGTTLPVWKANFHTHSTLSDGALAPQELIAAYRDAGCAILNLSDHRRTNPVSAYDPCGMTLISGIEMHPMGPRGIPWHLLAVGVPENFQDCSELAAQQVIDCVNAVGGVVFIAHPYWCGLTSAELYSLTGHAGIEVCNATCGKIGKSYSMHIWDELLDVGRSVNAIAVDDLHGNASDCCKAWTMVAAESSDQAAVLDALRRGSYYASQGPEFFRLSFDGTCFEAEFSECREAVLYTPQYFGARQFDAAGKLTRMRFDASHLAPGSFLRCQITDNAGKIAWSNPVYRA